MKRTVRGDDIKNGGGQVTGYSDRLSHHNRVALILGLPAA